MSDAEPSEVTQLLASFEWGDEAALEKLTPLVYDELKKLARRHMRGERSGHTLNTTGLVHEAFLKMVGQSGATYVNRAQFFAIASMTMRRILVNWARAKRQQKRGGGATDLNLDEALAPLSDVAPEELLAIDTALTRLSSVSARAVKVVECRYFAGLTIPETADARGISPATVKREWTLARSWLKRELTG
jgi:RNA polymerase sigma factor (TIGR02999 family)